MTEERKDETTKVSVLISLMTSRQEKNSPNESSVKIVLLLKYIFLGVHVEDKNIELEKIVVSYSNLNKWISALHDLEIDRSQEERIYNSPAITVNDECRIQITSSPTFQKVDSKTIIEDNIRFTIESLGDKSFSHYLRIEGKLRDFLNFVITKGAVIVQSFEGFVKQESELRSFTVLFRTYITERMHKIDVKSPSLFHYSDVSADLKPILDNWFRLYSQNKVIMDLFFGVVYNTQSFPSNNFIMLFTAIEAYHQAAMDDCSKRKKEKVFFGDILLKKVEEYGFLKEERERLEQLINLFGKQLSSKERLEEIYDQFADILPSLAYKIETRNKFIRKIVDIRNDLSHGNVHPDSLNKDNELIWQYRNLQLMLQLCILSQIGFTNEKIRKIYLLV